MTAWIASGSASRPTAFADRECLSGGALGVAERAGDHPLLGEEREDPGPLDRGFGGATSAARRSAAVAPAASPAASRYWPSLDSRTAWRSRSVRGPSAASALSA